MHERENSHYCRPLPHHHHHDGGHHAFSCHGGVVDDDEYAWPDALLLFAPEYDDAGTHLRLQIQIRFFNITREGTGKGMGQRRVRGKVSWRVKEKWKHESGKNSPLGGGMNFPLLFDVQCVREMHSLNDNVSLTII